MDNSPFSATQPAWVQEATHSTDFHCPCCGHASQEAKSVWVNRRAPVYVEGMYHRKWQEFYHCDCGTGWWGWSSDRPIPEWLQARNAQMSNEPTQED